MPIGIYWIVFGFIAVVFVQIILLRYRRYAPSTEYSTKIVANELPRLSIIICAKNEAENLQKNLPQILRQNYPKDYLEIIVVNDASEDNTAEVLEGFAKKYSFLKVISVPQNQPRQFPGKKWALHLGIQAAQSPTLLLTDADCFPTSDLWATSMISASRQQNKAIILGYGGYQKRNSFLNKLIRYETLETFIQYAGMALAEKPYMGVGRNLLYPKQLYLEALKDETFRQIYTAVISGDDDLLIGQISHTENTGICLHPEAFTLSKPAANFKKWQQQKTRHVSTGKYYPRSIKFILGLQALTTGLFWLLGLIILTLTITTFLPSASSWEKLLLAIGVYAGFVRLYLYSKNARKWYHALHEADLTVFYPIGEFSLSLLRLIWTPFIFWKNKKQWNSSKNISAT